MNPNKINPKNFIEIGRTRIPLGLELGIPSSKYNGSKNSRLK